MPAYLDLAGFKLASTMPSSDVDGLESASPGFLSTQLEIVSADIDARLRKRYDAPFAAPYPLTVKRWLARIVTREAYLKRGVDPDDRQFATIDASAARAETEIAEAANSETGLYDLPLRADTTSTGATKGGPFGYSEQSPYTWQDLQADVGRNEDANRRGTGNG